MSDRQNKFVAAIDDEEDIATLFKAVLSKIDDVEAICFTDAQVALEHVKANSPNYALVLSDYRMPEMTGLELLQQVKKFSPDVKRILISAFDIEEGLLRESDSVDKFLQKPISAEDLLKEVKQQLDCSKQKTRSTDVPIGF